MWLVMRAPFLPMGSLAICTRISWPSLSKSLIFGTSCVCARGKRRHHLAGVRHAADPSRAVRTRGSLRVTCRSRWRTNLCPGVDRSVTTSFCFDHRFRFRLCFFQFQFLAHLLRFPAAAASAGAAPESANEDMWISSTVSRTSENVPDPRSTGGPRLFFELLITLI